MWTLGATVDLGFAFCILFGSDFMFFSKYFWLAEVVISCVLINCCLINENLNSQAKRGPESSDSIDQVWKL